MSFEEMIVALVGSLGAFALVGYLSAKVFGLIKLWINRKKGSVPEEEFNRLANAFMEHKKETQRRLQNLEAIASEKEDSSSSDSADSNKKIEAPNQEIEFEEHPQQEESQSGDSSFQNMLRE